MEMLYEDLEELCHAVEKDLEKTNEKLRMSGGEMSGSDLEYIDKLTHTLKSIKTTMAMMDADDGYSHDGRMSGGNYSGRYGMNGGNYSGYSYAGRGRNARRDSMGRYSRGYSRGNEEMLDQVRDLMEQAPDDQTRREFQKIIDRLEK